MRWTDPIQDKFVDFHNILGILLSSKEILDNIKKIKYILNYGRNIFRNCPWVLELKKIM